MSEYFARSALMQAVKDRLEVKPDRPEIVIGRISEIAAESLPAISIYAPVDNMEPSGAFWQFNASVNLNIEVHCQVAEGWCAAAEQETQSIITTLFADGSFRKLWKKPPSISIKQFMSDKGGPVVGEIITMSGELLRPRVISIDAGELQGIDIEQGAIDNESAG
jgi:hypothetical protein